MPSRQADDATSPALITLSCSCVLGHTFLQLYYAYEGVCIIYLTRVSKAHDRVGCSKVVKYIAGPLQIIDIIVLTLNPVLKYK